MSHDSSEPVTSVSELVHFYNSCNAEQQLLIGIEWERSAINRDTLKPVLYHGNNGYLAVLQRLVDEAGWQIIQGDRDFIIELQRGTSRITLEGDGRLELSSSARQSLHDLAREFRLHAFEMQEIGKLFNIGWIPIGFQPFHANEDIVLTDKKRYKLCMEVPGMESVIKRTNGLTVNFSVTNEENLIRKAQTAFRILPIIGAMFAASPLSEGKQSGYLDTRRLMVQSVLRERCDIPQNILSRTFSLKDWIEFYLDKSVLFICRPGKEEHTPRHRITFRTWMQEGYEGDYPTYQDFDQHVKTVWSDIRLRPGYIEYRVADSVPIWMALSVPAVIKGLLFDSENWESVAQLTHNWTYDDIVAADRAAWKESLRTMVNGKSLLWYAQNLVSLANEKLHSFHRIDNNQVDETAFLRPLKELVYIQEHSLAREISEHWDDQWKQDPRKLLEWCEQERGV